MISYELAKQLQDARFPQSGAGKRVAPLDKLVVRREDFAYVPTLEELIEACGNRFASLANNARNWRARADDSIAEGVGSTPIEAVAHLWLALNKKV